MKTYDATETYTKQYPVVLDLASEKEFKEYLLENGIEVTPEQLRQYRSKVCLYQTTQSRALP